MEPKPQQAEVLGLPRLGYVDGLRGIAAIMVVWSHCWQSVPGTHLLPATITQASAWQVVCWPSLFGSQMVYFFILLSGFSLGHGEWMRHEQGRATPYRVYLARRAWRILPGYYVAIALALMLSALFGVIVGRTHYPVVSFAPLTAKGLVAHLFLVHDYCEPWLFQVDAPLWSMAVEVQLYWLFPLAFRPLTRWRLGWLVPVAVAVCAGVGWLASSSPILGCRLVAGLLPWFVAGIVLAKLARTQAAGLERLRPGLLLAALACLGWAMLFARQLWTSAPASQLVWGVGFGLLVLGLYGAPEGVRNLPAWPATRRLGAWSYMLYMVHFPLLAVLGASTYGLGLTIGQQLSVMLALGTCVSLLAAWALYELVDRHGVARSRSLGQAARASSAELRVNRAQLGAPVDVFEPR